MAIAQAAISGSIQFSSTSNLVRKLFAASMPISAFVTGELVLPAATEDFVLSINTVSSPSLAFFTATGTIRVNVGGNTNPSYGSAGQQFEHFWGFGASYISGPLSFHFANSTASAQTVTYLIGRAG